MKQYAGLTLILVSASLLAASASFAQRPEPSPPAATIQTVGLSDITVSYSRPGVKGRVIWGDLVPYGKIWRAGANDKTAFTFEEDVIIAGQRIPRGNYSFYILPAEDDWTLIFNSDWEGHGTRYNEDADVLRFTVTPEPAPHEEWLRYGFDHLGGYRATAYLRWEKVKASFDVQIAPELPEVDEAAQPVLEVVDAVVVDLLTADLEGLSAHIADDYASDGETKANVLDEVRQAAEEGLLDDLVIEMEDAEITVHGDRARVTGIEGDSSAGDVDLTMELERRDGKWFIVG